MRKSVLIATMLISTGIILSICAIIGIIKSSTGTAEDGKMAKTKKATYDSSTTTSTRGFGENTESKIEAIKGVLLRVMETKAKSVFDKIGVAPINLKNGELSFGEKVNLYREFYMRSLPFRRAIDEIGALYRIYNGEELEIYGEKVILAGKKILRKQCEKIEQIQDKLDSMVSKQGHLNAKVLEQGYVISESGDKMEDSPELYKKLYVDFWKDKVVPELLSDIVALPSDAEERLRACFK